MPPNSEIEKLERRWRDNPKGTVFAPYAEVLRKNADYALARDVLRQGLELHPDHIPGNIVLGRCCLDVGEDGPAEAAFAHVLDLDSENVIALKALAEITERQGRLAEADNWLSRLISVDPSNEEARDQIARVTTARNAAAAALTSEILTREPASTAPTVEVALTPRPGPPAPTEPQDRAEAAAGEIDDVGDVAAFAEEALDSLLEAPAAPEPTMDRTIPAVGSDAEPVTPVSASEPEPLRGLEPAELNASAEGAATAEPLADLEVDEAFVPPVAESPARPSGPVVFSFGVEETAAEIDLRPAGSSEFQASDDSTSLLELSAGKSEFQVADAAEELRISGHGSSEYQTPSGAEELLKSAEEQVEPAPTPEVSGDAAAWGGPPLSSSLAAMAALPTQELSTEPPAEPPVDQPADSVPSWLLDEEEPEARRPSGDLTLIVPEPEPEAVASATPAEPEPEATAAPAAEPELVVEETRSSAELKLIFPDDAAQPEPHRVRRITQAEAAPPPAEEAPEPEPAVGEPEPIMTETMAELYDRQGHTAEALRVYRALAERQPADARLRDRIRELEARTAGASRRLTYIAVDTGGESVESFFRSLAEARPGSGGAVSGFDHAAAGNEDSSGAPTRPARDPLSLSAIFGEEPATAAPASATPEGPAPAKPAGGPDAFSFDQFFGGTGASGQGSSSGRPPGASEEDLDQFQNWLKSLKR